MKGMTYRNDKTGEATVEHTCDARAVFDKLAIIVVTYKRQQLLEELLASFAQLTVAPWRIVIVDNEHSDETQDMVDEFREKADGLWGTTDADRKGGTSRVVYAPQTDNLGGARWVFRRSKSRVRSRGGMVLGDGRRRRRTA